MKNYIENLYKILFEFDFDGVKDATTMPIAVGTLTWTSLFLFLTKNAIHGKGLAELKFFFLLIFFVVGTLIVWLFSAIFFELLAKIFYQSGKIRTLLTLTSYSLLPYIFFPCFELMKNFSNAGYFFGTKLQILLFLWVILIYAKALAKTYDLKKSSSILLVFIPLISYIFLAIWLIGTMFNVSYIYSV